MAHELCADATATRTLIARFLTDLEAYSNASAASTFWPRANVSFVVHDTEGPDEEEISEQLHVGPLAARVHVQRAMTKLGERDRAQLVVIAVQSGLVGVERPG
ncbi:hypothetical protein [Nocardia sp. NPDC003183]